MKHQLDYPSTELCPQCEADDGDFYNGLAIGELCDECKAFNRAVDEALTEKAPVIISRERELRSGWKVR